VLTPLSSSFDGRRPARLYRAGQSRSCSESSYSSTTPRPTRSSRRSSTSQSTPGCRPADAGAGEGAQACEGDAARRAAAARASLGRRRRPRCRRRRRAATATSRSTSPRSCVTCGRDTAADSPLVSPVASASIRGSTHPACCATSSPRTSTRRFFDQSPIARICQVHSLPR
jgi:hypothetical protein